MLERYVRYPRTLSEEERQKVRALLEQSEIAREIVGFYRDYYSELDEQGRSESDSVKSFIERILETIQKGKNPRQGDINPVG